MEEIGALFEPDYWSRVQMARSEGASTEERRRLVRELASKEGPDSAWKDYAIVLAEVALGLNETPVGSLRRIAQAAPSDLRMLIEADIESLKTGRPPKSASLIRYIQRLERLQNSLVEEAEYTLLSGVPELAVSLILCYLEVEKVLARLYGSDSKQVRHEHVCRLFITGMRGSLSMLGVGEDLVSASIGNWPGTADYLRRHGHFTASEQVEVDAVLQQVAHMRL